MRDANDALFHDVILSHHRAPHNYRSMDDATGQGDGHNPLCGDRVTVFAKVVGGLVDDVSFQGAGCAISRASASLMTQALRGRPVADVLGNIEAFRRFMTDDRASSLPEALGKLIVLRGVRSFPTRVPCATLPWHALHTALGRTSDYLSESV